VSHASHIAASAITVEAKSFGINVSRKAACLGMSFA